MNATTRIPAISTNPEEMHKCRLDALDILQQTLYSRTQGTPGPEKSNGLVVTLRILRDTYGTHQSQTSTIVNSLQDFFGTLALALCRSQKSRNRKAGYLTGVTQRRLMEVRMKDTRKSGSWIRKAQRHPYRSAIQPPNGPPRPIPACYEKSAAFQSRKQMTSDTNTTKHRCNALCETS